MKGLNFLRIVANSDNAYGITFTGGECEVDVDWEDNSAVLSWLLVDDLLVEHPEDQMKFVKLHMEQILVLVDAYEDMLNPINLRGRPIRMVYPAPNGSGVKRILENTIPPEQDKVWLRSRELKAVEEEDYLLAAKFRDLILLL